MILPDAFWVLTFMFHVAGCLFVGYQLRSPYRYRGWLVAWGLFLALLLSMLAQRLTWAVEYSLFAPHAQRELLWILGNSVLACGTAYAMWRLLQPTPASPSVPPAYICIDAQSTILAWDAEAARLFGHTAPEALEKDLTHLIMQEEDATMHRKALAEWVVTPPPHRGRSMYLTVAVDRYGMLLPVSIRFRPEQRDDGTWIFHGYVRRMVEL